MQFVDVLAMKIIDTNAGVRCKLINRTHAKLRAGYVVNPNGQGSSPIAIPRDCPINSTLKPFPHASALDVSRNPIDFLVGLLQRRSHAFNLHVPGVDGTIDNWRVGSRAEGVAVNDDILSIERLCIFKHLDDVFVRVFYVHASKIADFRRKLPTHIYRANHCGDASRF